MKVKELIEKLKEFDPELLVLGNFEDGYEHIHLGEGIIWVDSNLDATALIIGEDYQAPYLTAKDVDEKFLIEKPEPPTRSAGHLNAIMDNLKVIISDQINRDTVIVTNLNKPKPTGDYVEFPIHVTRSPR